MSFFHFMSFKTSTKIFLVIQIFVLPIAFSQQLKTDQTFLDDLTSKVNVSENIQIFWKFHPDSMISMAFRWKSKGYFSLGFGTSMSSMDVIVAEIIGDEIILSDRWAQTRKTPKLDSELGGQNDLIPLGFILKDEEDFAIVKFSRKLNTNDKYYYIYYTKK